MDGLKVRDVRFAYSNTNGSQDAIRLHKPCNVSSPNICAANATKYALSRARFSRQQSLSCPRFTLPCDDYIECFAPRPMFPVFLICVGVISPSAALESKKRKENTAQFRADIRFFMD